MACASRHVFLKTPENHILKVKRGRLRSFVCIQRQLSDCAWEEWSLSSLSYFPYALHSLHEIIVLFYSHVTHLKN